MKYTLKQWLIKWYFENGYTLMTEDEMIKDAIKELQLLDLSNFLDKNITKLKKIL